MFITPVLFEGDLARPGHLRQYLFRKSFLKTVIRHCLPGMLVLFAVLEHGSNPLVGAINLYLVS